MSRSSDALIAGATESRPRAYTLARFGRFLVVRFAEIHDVASWAVVNGGLTRSSTVAWVEVSDSELCPPVDPVRWLRDELAGASLTGAVGLMTSRTLDSYVERTHTVGDAGATCVATVALGNALRAGDPPGPVARTGTINVLCRVDCPLSHEALLEAGAIATEAKVIAVLEEGILSRVSGRSASGTGTDYVVIAAPRGPARARYTGKHTDVGAAIGAAVEEAVRAGVRAWVAER